MEESILKTVKKLVGDNPDYEGNFDEDLIVFINTAFGILNQLGVGPVNGFSISGDTETWNDYISDDLTGLEMAKTYVFLKAKLVFDPPQSSSVIDALTSQVAELEYRLFVQNDPYPLETITQGENSE